MTPLTRTDLDGIARRFDAGTWTARDVAGLFAEIDRLTARVEALEAPMQPEIVDDQGWRWSWHAAGYLRSDDGETLTAAQVAREFGLAGHAEFVADLAEQLPLDEGLAAILASGGPAVPV